MPQFRSPIRLRHVAGLLAVAALAAASPAVQAQAPAAAPSFSYQLDWLQVPSQWKLGEIAAVAVDGADNVWILQRPRSLAAADRDKAAPAVLAFDSSGKFIRAFGGPGAGYEWPTNEHSLFVDAKNRVWLSGNSANAGAADNTILAFTAEGQFIRQIGKQNASKGDRDTENVNRVADIFVDTERNELYAADGYSNRRIIVFDTETGAFKRMWGAFGAAPPATPPGPPLPAMRPPGIADQEGRGSIEFRSVHGVEVSKDGLVYVSDRDNQRVQVFDRMGRYRTQVFVHRNSPSRQTAAGLALSPDQRWLYVIDFGNAQVVVYDRKTLKEVATIGSSGTAPGQFVGPHLMATDSKGVVYIAEVVGRRLQRLVPN
jgi:DNA-binding beta-propeller fold protein YncE